MVKKAQEPHWTYYLGLTMIMVYGTQNTHGEENDS